MQDGVPVGGGLAGIMQMSARYLRGQPTLRYCTLTGIGSVAEVCNFEYGLIFQKRIRVPSKKF